MGLSVPRLSASDTREYRPRLKDTLEFTDFVSAETAPNPVNFTPMTARHTPAEPSANISSQIDIAFMEGGHDHLTT